MICSVGAENKGCKCWSFSSFLVFHYIAMCLTVNETKKNCWKHLVTSSFRLFYKSEIGHQRKRWATVFSLWNYFYLGNVCEETFMCFSTECNNFDWKKCNSKYEVLEYVMSFLSSNCDTAHKVITIFWNFAKLYFSASQSGKCTQWKWISIGLSARTGGGCPDYALRMMEADSVQLNFIIKET